MSWFEGMRAGSQVGKSLSQSYLSARQSAVQEGIQISDAQIRRKDLQRRQAQSKAALYERGFTAEGDAYFGGLAHNKALGEQLIAATYQKIGDLEKQQNVLNTQHIQKSSAQAYKQYQTTGDVTAVQNFLQDPIAGTFVKDNMNITNVLPLDIQKDTPLMQQIFKEYREDAEEDKKENTENPFATMSLEDFTNQYGAEIQKKYVKTVDAQGNFGVFDTEDIKRFTNVDQFLTQTERDEIEQAQTPTGYTTQTATGYNVTPETIEGMTNRQVFSQVSDAEKARTGRLENLDLIAARQTKKGGSPPKLTLADKDEGARDILQQVMDKNDFDASKYTNQVEFVNALSKHLERKGTTLDEQLTKYTSRIPKTQGKDYEHLTISRLEGNKYLDLDTETLKRISTFMNVANLSNINKTTLDGITPGLQALGFELGNKFFGAKGGEDKNLQKAFEDIYLGQLSHERGGTALTATEIKRIEKVIPLLGDGEIQYLTKVVAESTNLLGILGAKGRDRSIDTLQYRDYIKKLYATKKAANYLLLMHAQKESLENKPNTDTWYYENNKGERIYKKQGFWNYFGSLGTQAAGKPKIGGQTQKNTQLYQINDENKQETMFVFATKEGKLLYNSSVAAMNNITGETRTYTLQKNNPRNNKNVISLADIQAYLPQSSYKTQGTPQNIANGAGTDETALTDTYKGLTKE